MTELPAATVKQMSEFVDSKFNGLLATLKQLVSIPSIAWDAFDPANLEASANAVADLFRATEAFDWVEVRRAKHSGGVGASAVVARRAAKNGAAQVLLYAHHDVQPPGDESAWKTKPFEAIELNGRLYGRGAADDKAGIISHLGAVGAVQATLGSDFDLGLTVFIEGEEEAGSPSFANFLAENADDLKADVIIVADSGNWDSETPALTSTLRGMTSQVIRVETLDHALHSGMFGGAVADSLTAMIRLLATLHDADGNVAVAGLTSHASADLPYSEEQLREDAGVLEGVDLIGSGSLVQRIWGKPAITVIGLDNPSVALSSNTLQPATQAKISLRVAPGQDSQVALDCLRAHLQAHVPFGAKLTFGEVEVGQPYLVDSSGWATQLMRNSLDVAYGKAPVDMGIGGSIPFIADLTKQFPAAQILITGVEDPDSRAHSPNESLDIDMLRRTTLAQALFLAAANARQ
ncbi:MAG: hypothetical protein RL670_142 [Actinomycetota bacterium]